MKKYREIIIVLIISAIAIYINVGTYGVIESSDARYAEIARAMYASGDYLHPNLLNIHHYHKPPFTYQITALGYEIFGVTPFAARFFLQIAVLIQIILVYAIALLLFRQKKIALFSALVYFSFPIVLISSRNLTTDAFLTLFVLLSLYSWLKYRLSNKPIYLYLFSFSLALGFLTKGALILVVPIIFMIAYNFFIQKHKQTSIHHYLASIVFLLVGFSWFIYLAVDNQSFIDYFLGKQTIDRFSKNAFDRTEPFWYFIVLTPLLGMPWLLALPYLIKNNLQIIKDKPIFKVLIVSFIIPLIFFSISSSKRILYILPLYILFALLVAGLLQFSKSTVRIKTLKFVFAYAILLFIGQIGISFFLKDYNIPFQVIIISVIGLLISILIYATKKIEINTKSIFITYLSSIILLINASSLMAANELKVNSPKPVTDFILKNNLNNRVILIYNTRKPSIAFGLNKQIISLYNGSNDLSRETQFETDLNWKKYLINLKDPTELSYLKELSEKPSVLMLYNQKLPKNLSWLKKDYKYEKILEKYTLYY